MTRRAAVPAPAALDPATTENQRTAAKVPWWQTEQSFVVHESARDRLQPRERAYFLIGDEVLEVASNESSILDLVRAHYGDCELTGPNRAKTPLIRCDVNIGYPSSLIAIEFLQDTPLDLAAIALGLSHPPRGAPPYAISDAQRNGWSLIGGSDHSVAAASRTGLLVDSGRVADDFVADYLVAAALGAQSHLMVLHAAAVQIGSRGAILTGASHAGKTTTSLHLASRGHCLFGDELTAVRLRSRELLPLRRSLSLRAGPRSPALASALQQVRPCEGHSVDGKFGPLRINELFSARGDEPVGLKAAFFLSGFSDRPVIEPFDLTLNDEKAFDYMSANDVASISWGLKPQRRALRLLALKQLFGRVNCWRLCVGSPDDTAKLIESTMEEG
jgi:hypothetical protein